MSPHLMENTFLQLFTNIYILADILRTNDELTAIIERYEALARNVRPPAPSTQLRGAALDLLDLGPALEPIASPRSVLDDQLLSLGIFYGRSFIRNDANFITYLGLDDLAPSPSPGVNLLQPFKVESNGMC